MTKKEAGKKLKKNPETNGLIGFVLGIISIIFIANNGLIVGIVGLAFSIRQQKTKPTREGKLGIILNTIGIILAIIMIIVTILYLGPLIEQQIAAGGISLT